MLSTPAFVAWRAAQQTIVRAVASSAPAAAASAGATRASWSALACCSGNPSAAAVAATASLSNAWAATKTPATVPCASIRWQHNFAAEDEEVDMAQRITEGPMARKRRPTPAPVDYEPMNRKPKVTAGQAELGRELMHHFGRPLTQHELSLFDYSGEELPKVEDHGYQWGLPEDLLADRNDSVKRVCSTYTADLQQTRAFNVRQLINKYSLEKYDTGSSRVSVAVLTAHIRAVSEHLRRHPKDKHSKRALLLYSNRRRRLLRYMLRKDYNNYRIIVRELGIPPVPLFNSPYPPAFLARKRLSHKEVKRIRSRYTSKKRRGHKGH